MSETEYMVRGRGYLRNVQDIGNIVLKADPSGSGTPVLIKDVARIELGPDERRGIAEMNGNGRSRRRHRAQTRRRRCTHDD